MSSPSLELHPFYNSCLLVIGIPATLTSKYQLNKHFCSYGEIAEIQFARFLGQALIYYRQEKDARKALHFFKKNIFGRIVGLSMASSSRQEQFFEDQEEGMRNVEKLRREKRAADEKKKSKRSVSKKSKRDAKKKEYKKRRRDERRRERKEIKNISYENYEHKKFQYGIRNEFAKFLKLNSISSTNEKSSATEEATTVPENNSVAIPPIANNNSAPRPEGEISLQSDSNAFVLLREFLRAHRDPNAGPASIICQLTDVTEQPTFDNPPAPSQHVGQAYNPPPQNMALANDASNVQIQPTFAVNRIEPNYLAPMPKDIQETNSFNDDRFNPFNHNFMRGFSSHGTNNLFNHRIEEISYERFEQEGPIREIGNAMREFPFRSTNHQFNHRIEGISNARFQERHIEENTNAAGYFSNSRHVPNNNYRFPTAPSHQPENVPQIEGKKSPKNDFSLRAINDRGFATLDEVKYLLSKIVAARSVVRRNNGQFINDKPWLNEEVAVFEQLKKVTTEGSNSNVVRLLDYELNDDNDITMTTENICVTPDEISNNEKKVELRTVNFMDENDPYPMKFNRPETTGFHKFQIRDSPFHAPFTTNRMDDKGGEVGEEPNDRDPRKINESQRKTMDLPLPYYGKMVVPDTDSDPIPLMIIDSDSSESSFSGQSANRSLRESAIKINKKIVAINTRIGRHIMLQKKTFHYPQMILGDLKNKPLSDTAQKLLQRPLFGEKNTKGGKEKQQKRYSK